MDQMKIGAFIAALRKEKGWTQEELGERVGVTNKTVSRWENGNYMPSIEILSLLSREFSVSLNELVQGQRLEEAEFRAAADQNLASALERRPFDRLRRWLWRNHIAVTIVFVLCVLLAIACVQLYRYQQTHPRDVGPLGTYACRDVFYDGRFTWIYLTFFEDRYFISDAGGHLFDYGTYSQEGEVVRLNSVEETRWAVIKGKNIFDRSPLGEGLMDYEFISQVPAFVNSPYWPSEVQPFLKPSKMLPE